MTTYTKITDYAAKDSLITGNPSKVVRGTEIDAEFTSIASADADSVKVSGLGANVATFLATPSSANLAAAITDETGSGANVFATSPTLVTPALGTPSSGTLTSCTGLPVATGISGLGTGIATALAVNVGTAGSPVVNGGALGTPSSGTVTNLTGTASININGTVGATTPAAGTFTTLTSTGNATLGDAEASDTHAIKGATTLLANSASAALTVTQTGAGNAFVVEDSASTDSTPFVIDASGKVIIGGTASVTARLLEIQDAGSAPFALVQTSDTATNASWTDVYRKRATGNVVQSGDRIGGARFFGNDGSAYIEAARVLVEVDGTPGTNDMPGRLVFSTTADGASSPTERMRIDSSGNVGVGGTANARTKLGVLGTYPATTGVSISLGILGNVDPAATSAAQYCTFISPTVGAGTLPDLRYNYVSQGTFTGSVTSQYGYSADSTLTGATNNYGFYSNIASGANRYNFYAAGTADNYFAGAVTCNTTLTVTTSATVGGSAVVTLAASQTLTNKTLTSPTLTAPVLGTPSSGNLSSCTADGTNAVGFLHIPQNSQSAPYTLVLGDAGKHILHPSADTTARTITIPANSSVAFPIGTAVTFVNQASAGVMTIAITTDTMRLAGAGTTGSRTLAANGVATAIKLTSTEWIISGTNLT